MDFEMSKTGSINNTAKVVGALFIIGTVAGIINVAFTGSIIGSPDYLVKLAANQNRIMIGAFFELVMAVACASIAIWLYPVLKHYSESLALGAVGFRLIEGALMFGIVVCLFLMLALSHEYIHAGVQDSQYFQTFGVLIKAGYDWVSNVGILVAWCIGALMYYYIFYQTRLIPRWLSGWGLVGAALCIGASMLVMFQVIDPMSTVQSVLNLPIGLQEMVMAVWLIVKGFDHTAAPAKGPDRMAIG
jgi:hypothetical protein